MAKEGELSDMSTVPVVSPAAEFPFVLPPKYPNLDDELDLSDNFHARTDPENERAAEELSTPPASLNLEDAQWARPSRLSVQRPTQQLSADIMLQYAEGGGSQQAGPSHVPIASQITESTGTGKLRSSGRTRQQPRVCPRHQNTGRKSKLLHSY